MRAVLTWCAACACLVGCTRKSELYCLKNPYEPECLTEDPDIAGCVANACASQVCLPEGTCADPGAVLYAASDGAGLECTIENKCSLTDALSLVAPGRNVVHVEPGVYMGGYVIGPAQAPVQIIGSGAVLTGPPMMKSVLSIANQADVELYGLAVLGGKMAPAISCTGAKLTARKITLDQNEEGAIAGTDCDLAVARSTFKRNKRTVIDATRGTIAIQSNLIFANNVENGAVVSVTDATGELRHNTIVFNTVMEVTKVPVICAGTSAPNAGGNIITSNGKRMMATFTAATNQATGCAGLETSYTRAEVVDDGWRHHNPNDFADVTNDYHLTSASPVEFLDALAGCVAPLDFDGDARPLGAGCELGADELAP